LDIAGFRPPDQTLDAQIEQLKAAGATKIFAEKVSGARSDRPQLRRALAALGEGDTLVVTHLRIDPERQWRPDGSLQAHRHRQRRERHH
jgi:hypothetical protein